MSQKRPSGSEGLQRGHNQTPDSCKHIPGWFPLKTCEAKHPLLTLMLGSTVENSRCIPDALGDTAFAVASVLPAELFLFWALCPVVLFNAESTIAQKAKHILAHPLEGMWHTNKVQPASLSHCICCFHTSSQIKRRTGVATSVAYLAQVDSALGKRCDSHSRAKCSLSPVLHVSTEISHGYVGSDHLFSFSSQTSAGKWHVLTQLWPWHVTSMRQQRRILMRAPKLLIWHHRRKGGQIAAWLKPMVIISLERSSDLLPLPNRNVLSLT